MKVVLVYRIKGKLEKIQQKLVKEVGPKFGEEYMIENPLPVHVTLSSPFEFKKIKEVDNFVKQFVKNKEKSIINVRGFGKFDNKVAYIKTTFSKQGRLIQRKLVKDLYEEFGKKPHEFDLKWKPHSTISYGNSKESFDNIWKHLRELEKPAGELSFDNITILKKPKKFWKIHREYKIK
jgi:2'-5' RNA ligase